MLKIGDFSRLSQVTIKALRFYDEMGLLKPAQVDEVTGYRYYAAGQLPQLNRILALKDLGFTLEQIRPLMVGGVTAQQLRQMLDDKRSEVARRIEAERALLARVEARLSQIEQENTMLEANVVVKKLDPVRVASVRDTIPAYSDVGRLLGEVFGALGQQRQHPIGPPLSIWHDPEYKEQDIDAEAAIPVGPSAQASGRVQTKELAPLDSAACYVHKGSYRTLNAAYAALMRWIEANGYRMAGPVREVYIYCGDGPVGQDDESYVTELQAPVEKA